MDVRNVIPEVINKYNVYDEEGTKILGTGEELELPELEAITDTITGGGVLGEIEDPVTGMFSSAKLTIPFRVPTPDLVGVFKYNAMAALTIRGSAQCIDPKTYESGSYPVRLVVRGKPTKISFGTFSPGKKSESEVELEVFYIKLEINQETAFELDKLNEIFVINGEDMLKDIRAMA